MNGLIDWIAVAPESSRPAYVIRTAPHVMIRLKRIFERLRKSDIGVAVLQDTAENARELLWFCERYPHDITAAARTHLDAGAAVHRSREVQVAEILAGRYVAPSSLAMALPARPYQQLAADLVATTGRLLLGDDLGLGKTISAIAAIATSGKLPALVVTLTHLPRQWQAEFARFTPGLRTHILKNGKPYPVEADVLISNYHKLGGWAEELAGKIRTIVFDEVQELRKSETHKGPTVKYAAATAIARQAEIKLGLSATPIYNYGGEMFSVLNALEEGCLGSQAEFQREWTQGDWDKAQLKDPVAFGGYLRDSGLMLRRTRAEVGRELPTMQTIPYEIDADKDALKRVDSEMAELARIILAEVETERGNRFRAAGQLDFRLRRATGMAKASFVADFTKMLIESGERVVLYGWHHDVYEVWKHALRDYKPAFYTGKESTSQKEREINRFKSGETPLAILSLRSGAGLDGLQANCRTVVFGELDWSPGVHEQAIGRVHRDGQTEPVCAYFLISDSGSDPIVADTLGVKKGQIQGLRDPDAPLVDAGIDPHHIKRLAENILAKRGEIHLPAAAFSPKVATPKPSFKPKEIQLNLFEEVS